MIDSSQKGLLTELQCQADFTRLGILLSQPITQDSRYDFIADIDGVLTKIQCKTAKVDADETYIQFSGYTTNIRNNTTKCYNSNEIDYFYTCYSGKSYLIPQKEVGRCKTLRFSSNENHSTICWAEDYELKTVLLKDFGYSCDEVTTTIIQKTTSKNTCSCCGKKISKNSEYCVECSHLSQRRVTRPEREELKQMSRTKTFTQIGKDFNVSDNAIRIWCRKMNLPSSSAVIKAISDEDWSKI